MVLAAALAPWSALHDGVTWVGGKPALSAWLHAGAGLLAGAALILGIRWIGSAILKKEAMGLGDVKLLAFIGAVVGPGQVLYTLVLGCLGGAVIGGIAFLVGRRRPMPCAATARIGTLEAAFDRVRVLPGEESMDVLLDGAPQAKPGDEVRLALTLPAKRVLEDDDAAFEVTGRLHAVASSAAGHLWTVRLTGLDETTSERLWMFGYSYKYIPFGPFLAIGGAASMLYGHHVHWLITKGYPEWVRSLGG